MATATSIVEVVKCKTAGDLLDAIAGSRSQFACGRPYSWLFRGAASNDYTLTPSALRPGALERFTLDSSDFSQIDGEWRVLRTFYELANLRGMSLPQDSQRLYRLMQSSRAPVPSEARDDESRWPARELLSLCGLAQHYGLPTRLLDWTYDPRVAAYFAARGVMSHMQDATPLIKGAVKRYLSHTGGRWNEQQFDASHHGPTRTMAVWAFNKMFDDSLRLREQFAPPEEPVPYETVTIPYATNPNIQAQQGVFTVVRHKFASASIDRTPLDETLHAYLRRYFPDALKTNQSTVPLFTKFQLPWTQYQALLKQLANAGVNASTVFPGYYGVVDAVREKLWWWDAPPAR